MTARASYSPTAVASRTSTVSDTIGELAQVHDRIVRAYFFDDVTADQQAQLEAAARSIRFAIADLTHVLKGWERGR